MTRDSAKNKFSARFEHRTLQRDKGLASLYPTNPCRDGLKIRTKINEKYDYIIYIILSDGQQRWLRTNVGFTHTFKYPENPVPIQRCFVTKNLTGVSGWCINGAGRPSPCLILQRNFFLIFILFSGFFQPFYKNTYIVVQTPYVTRDIGQIGSGSDPMRDAWLNL